MAMSAAMRPIPPDGSDNFAHIPYDMRPRAAVSRFAMPAS